MQELLKLAIESGIPITAELVKLYLWLDYGSPIAYIPLFFFSAYWCIRALIRFFKWLGE